MAGTKGTSKSGGGTKGTTKTTTTSKNTSSNVSKNTTTKTSNNAKAGGGSTVGTNVGTTKVTTTAGKTTSTPYAVGTAKNGGTIYSDGSVKGGMSTANKNTTNNKNTSNNNTKTTTTTLSNGVKATNNGNGTTTYTKANGDRWTENSSGQVVSKTVNGKTTNYASGDTSGGIYKSTANNSSKNGTTGTSKTTTATNNTLLAGVGNNYMNAFTNNVAGAISGAKTSATSKTSSSSGDKVVGQTKNANGTTTYKKANGDTWTENASGQVISKTVGGKTTNYKAGDLSGGIYASTAPSSTTSNTSKTTSSSSSKAYPVASTADGKVRMSDGSVVTQAQANAMNAKSQNKSTTTKTLTTTATSNTANKSYNYKEQNANGSKAIASMADGSIKYADGSVYNPQTGITTDKNGNQVKAQGTETKATEGDIRNNANTRANNTGLQNSSNYNPVSNNKNVTTDRNNQSALTMILKNQQGTADKGGNITTVQSKALDTGGNRDIASQEKAYSNGDGTATYIAPNGKQYTIGKDDNGNWAFGDSDGNWQNLTDGEGNINNNVRDIASYIKSQNQTDGINRSNVDNSSAVRDATIIGTYNAPSGKEYDIVTNDRGQTGFVNINGETQWFDTQDAALDYIDERNPVGSKDLAKNTIKPEWQNRVSDVVEDMNEERSEDKEEEQDRNEDLKEYVEEMFNEWKDSQDEIDRNKYNILNQSLNDWENFQVKLDDAVADLEEKSKLLQDNERMRWARQRAQQLAAQGYLTSEQVAQVANYSLTDYNKELEANALEAAKAVAELRLNIAQKANDALAAIRSQQFSNENDRMNQINFVNEWRTKMEDAINSKMSQVDQFYNGLINSNLQMNAQNELGYESIVNQNRAQNMADDQNQIRAFNDPVYRRQYILDHITDANLHGYADQAIQYLINNGQFYFPGKSNADNKRILAEQIAKVTDAARQLQLENQKDLAKL